MKDIIWCLFTFLFAQLLNACSLEQLKGAGYEALYQNQCMREEGGPDCNPEHMSYDEYKQIRDAELMGKRIDR